ncbi:MAG TPA: hypothetical protein VLI05_00715 [Candidatus Saccharimonadia bacterium]|nr:hypothetical protein [Candidatus Saccharimonadia bacterium]
MPRKKLSWQTGLAAATFVALGALGVACGRSTVAATPPTTHVVIADADYLEPTTPFSYRGVNLCLWRIDPIVECPSRSGFRAVHLVNDRSLAADDWERTAWDDSLYAWDTYWGRPDAYWDHFYGGRPQYASQRAQYNTTVVNVTNNVTYVKQAEADAAQNKVQYRDTKTGKTVAPSDAPKVKPNGFSGGNQTSTVPNVTGTGTKPGIVARTTTTAAKTTATNSAKPSR